MTDSLRESLTAAVEAVDGDSGSVVSNETIVPESPEQPAEKAERARDEQGRFAKTEEAAPVVPEVERKPRPKSWRKDYEADWEKLDPRIADYIHEREEQYTNGVTTYKQEWERAKPLLDVFAPYSAKLQQYGARPEQILPALFNAHLGLVEGSPQQRAAILQNLARQYNVQLGESQEPQIDPNTQALLQKIQQTQQGVQTLQQYIEERENAEAALKIEQFASQKDKYPFFDEAKGLMAQLIEQKQADSLESAYNKAIRLDDALWEREQERKQKQIPAPQVVAAKAKAAAVSPKTASPTGVVAKASDGDMRSQLSAAFDAAVSGRV